MAEEDDLWTSVKANFDSRGLVTLTNPKDRSATTIDDTYGTTAAKEAIDLWDLFAQVDYDGADAKHLAVARHATIAVLWRRGGTASTIEQVKWDSVFGPEGMIARVRATGPRGHPEPISNSGVQNPTEAVGGRKVVPWSSRKALPTGYLPDQVRANDS